MTRELSLSRAEASDLRARQDRLEDRIRALGADVAAGAAESERAQQAAEHAWAALAKSERALAESRLSERDSAIQGSQWRQRHEELREKYSKICRVLQVEISLLCRIMWGWGQGYMWSLCQHLSPCYHSRPSR